MDEGSDLSNTPPSAKRQKKVPAKRAASAEPLEDMENESFVADMDGDSEKKKAKTSATDRYQKLTQLEHIIKRPDTYIGSVERTEQTMWVFNSHTEQMETRKVNFVPGLYKIFDEILVNAADNKQNDASMKSIKVTVDKETGVISVENDGRGIPVEMHKKEKIYIPEMIFGHLLTSSNYDDEEAKTTGGRNGYGAKLCNIFSTEFTLETQDSKNGKRYKQTWTDNMSNMQKAKITSNKAADFTRITFKPDWKKFKMDGIDDDFEALVKRRVYDLAGTVKGVSVYLDGNKIKVNNFKKYIEMYAKAIQKERGVEVDAKDVAASVILDDNEGHPRWEIGFAVSDGSFQQVSFVNSIATTSGGTHVNYIADQICTKLLEVVKKKNSKGSTLKLGQIRNHIFLFVNCLITNPAFTSQTKEQLTTKVSQFGSKCSVSEAFLKKIAKTDAVENILHFAQQKADQVLAKSDGNRRSRMTHVKLVDANLAGTRRGHECTLILTEGDSAKGLAVAGRAILDPDRIGVFPLRGKMLNVRDASFDQISKNAEILNIKQFLGLKHKTVYTDPQAQGLRYGHLMIMADQDHDGSHIKGLLINFLQVQYPSLLKIPNFFQEFITPIVKVWKKGSDQMGPNAKTFFNMPQYEEWKESHPKGYDHKYFKGLGTSSNVDAQVYFTQLDKHLKQFDTMKEEEEELFDLAFSKKKADQRKQWLGNFRPGTFLDHTEDRITYNDFVNKELILFSMADNMRSIPSVADGLKPGQRKVLFAAFKRNIVKDIKVVELAGYCMGITAYAHGESSLQGTIVGLAQDFVGSNNVNMLMPSGNFGSRLAGGSDAASPRYIYTRLSAFARVIFSTLDEPLLDWNVDDDKKIEPKTYAPIVPMVLINGAEGIGTGWSTSIPNYHPKDVVNNLKRRMGRLDKAEEDHFVPMTPWFRGWKGKITEAGPDRFRADGEIREGPGANEVEITELPIRVWTDDYKAKLEEFIKGDKGAAFVKDYKEFNDHDNVHFQITLDGTQMQNALREGLEEKFKLQKQIATSNLVCFDLDGRIKKYANTSEIMDDFYEYRLELYEKRREHWLRVIDKEYRKLSNQARFVLEIIDNKLVVSKKSKPKLVAELRARKYEPFPKVGDAKKAGEDDDVVENTDDVADDEEGGARDYDYLLGLPIWSLTQERVDKLEAQKSAKKAEYNELEAKDAKDLWCEDLDRFMDVWDDALSGDNNRKKNIRSIGRRASKKLGVGSKAASKKVKNEDDDFAPKVKKAPAKKVAREPTETAKAKFAALFNAKPAVKPAAATDGNDDGMSDDDFAALAPGGSKAPVKRSPGRAAAPKTIKVDEDTDMSDEDFAAVAAAASSKDTSKNSLRAQSTSAQSSRIEQLSDDDVPVSRPKPKAGAKKVSKVESDDDDFMELDEPIPAALKGKVKPARKAAASKPKSVMPLASDDDDFMEVDAAPAKAYTKKNGTAVESDDDDDDFAEVEKEPVVPKAKAGGRAPRAAAAKKLVIPSDSESEDDSLQLGDIGAMVKGIGGAGSMPPPESASKRVSLFSMGGPVAGGSRRPSILENGRKEKGVMDEEDDTNYEMLAQPSPAASRKTTTKVVENVDLSDEDESIMPAGKKARKPVTKVTTKTTIVQKKAAPAAKPAPAKNLSPAAKAYAKKLEKATTAPIPSKLAPKKKVMSDSEDDLMAEVDDLDDDDDETAQATPAKPAPSGRGRPARAAAVEAKKKPSYIISDDEDEEEDSYAQEETVVEEESFMDDDDE